MQIMSTSLYVNTHDAWLLYKNKHTHEYPHMYSLCINISLAFSVVVMSVLDSAVRGWREVPIP